MSGNWLLGFKTEVDRQLRGNLQENAYFVYFFGAQQPGAVKMVLHMLGSKNKGMKRFYQWKMQDPTALSKPSGLKMLLMPVT